MTNRILKTDDGIREIIYELGYDLIYSYRSKTGTKKVVVKDKNNYKYDVSFYHLIDKNRNIEFVHVGNPFSLENIKIWLKLNNKPFELCEDNVYTGAKNLLKFKCFSYGDIFYVNWTNIYEGTICHYCSGQKVSDRNRLSIRFPNIASEWHPSKNGNLTPDDVSFGTERKVWWICNKGHEYFASIDNRTSGKGCPKCRRSNGESKISTTFDAMNIVYMNEYTGFKNCKDERILPFDFYLPKYNFCIEYHGPQHFEPIRFSYSVSQDEAIRIFDKQIIRDQIKRDYCYNNQINLLEIPYWDFNNIESILESELSNYVHN